MILSFVSVSEVQRNVVWNAALFAMHTFQHPHPQPPNIPSLELLNWRDRVEHARHFVRGHHIIRHAPDLASHAQTLEPNRHFPALGVVDDEDVFLPVGIADRGAEDVSCCLLALASLRLS